jgi:hypothetical protein
MDFTDDAGALQRKSRIGTDPSATTDDAYFHAFSRTSTASKLAAKQKLDYPAVAMI